MFLFLRAPTLSLSAFAYLWRLDYCIISTQLIESIIHRLWSRVSVVSLGETTLGGAFSRVELARIYVFAKGHDWLVGCKVIIQFLVLSVNRFIMNRDSAGIPCSYPLIDWLADDQIGSYSLFVCPAEARCWDTIFANILEDFNFISIRITVVDVLLFNS